MHQTPDQAVRLVGRLQEKMKPHTHVTTVVCPPFVDLAAVHKVADRDLVRVGAQNLNENDEGAFTGEVSGSMLAGLAEYVIVGHSERRRYEQETDKRIALKVAAAIRNNLTPVVCIGEQLHDREDGHAQRVVVDQLHGCLSQISDEDVHKIIVTYEPVWAISSGDGRGQSATPDAVKPMITLIRQTIEEIFGEGASSRVEILYGGSANPDDAQSYLEIDHVNGLLVGGASLNYEQFAAMIDIAARLADGR